MLSNQSVSGDEDMEASYPDSGSVNDSKEEGPEELKDVVIIFYSMVTMPENYFKNRNGQCCEIYPFTMVYSRYK